MNFWKRFFIKKMKEEDLNAESSKAAEFYLRTLGTGVPQDVRQSVYNYTAHGFYMGVRWQEEKMGMKKGVGRGSVE